jgi:hypothetical protein
MTDKNHSKSMTGINRPFNSQHRMHFRPMDSNNSGALFSRTTVFPKQDRTGGLSGQELAILNTSPD